MKLIRTAFALALVSGAVHAAPPHFKEDGRLARVQAQLPAIDKMYTELAAREHLPGLVYGVVVDGKLVHQRALGYANVEDKIAATASTRFRIASMSKSFVALAALKLRDQGKLRLDDAVSMYLPEFRKLRLLTADSPPLTVRMLTTMTTGLPEDNPWGDRQMELSNAQMEALVKGGLSMTYPSGQNYEYSNVGYMVLGKVVSKAAGMRFQDYVTKEILLPLGMRNTSWEYGKIAPADLALGYRWTGKAWEREPMLHDGDAAAMGGLITTLEDMARYVAFHLDAWPARDDVDKGPVRRSTLREMHLPQVFVSMNANNKLVDGLTPNPLVASYSHGMALQRDSQGTVVVGHGGGLPGFGSQYRFAPHHGVGVIALSNLRYGPVYAPTVKVLNELIQRATLPQRQLPPSSILLTRQQQVMRLLQTWDEPLGRDILAVNFFMDRSRADWMVHARDKLASIGKIVQVGALVPDNELRATFPLVGERGTLDIQLTLTPEKEPKVQHVSMEAAAKPPVVVEVRKTGYAAFGKEVLSVDELVKLVIDSGAKKIVARYEEGGGFEAIGKLIYGANRYGLEIEPVSAK